MRTLELSLLPEALSVCRLEPAAGLPAWALAGPFGCLLRTPGELTVVCSSASVPRGVAAAHGFRALRLLGVFDFSETGILAAVAAPLAAASVGIFAVSTYETDYVLVRETQLELATATLRSAGHRVSEPARGRAAAGPRRRAPRRQP